MVGKLTQKQENFCLNLFQGMTQRESWIKAGYSSRYAPAIIDTNAYRLAAKTEIQLRLAELRGKVEKEAVAGVEERQKRLTTLLRANLVDFVQDGEPVQDLASVPNNGALSEIVVKTRYKKDGEATIERSIKLRDPVSAIAELNKMDHVYDERPTTTNNTQINIIVNDAETKDLLLKVAERTGKLLGV